MNDAINQFEIGQELKSKGDIDKALTSFRRAVIADPRMTLAHIEIGHICKDKARLDPMFLRYAYEAFRSAARLDLNSQIAHDQYILMAQQMKLLDQLHEEYESWAKQYPDNELIQRCYKNLVTISVALFSPQVDVGKTRASGSMKKMVFFISLFALLIGVGLIFVPPVFSKGGKISKDNLKSFLVVGISFCVGGLGGLIFHRRMD